MSNFNFLTDISPELAQFGKSAELYCHDDKQVALVKLGNDSNLLIVFYVQIMPDDFVMLLHRF